MLKNITEFVSYMFKTKKYKLNQGKTLNTMDWWYY